MLGLIRRSASRDRRVAKLWRTGSFLKYELGHHVPIPWRDTMRALRMGFWTGSYCLYALRDRDPSEYLSDLARAPSRRPLAALRVGLRRWRWVRLAHELDHPP